MTVRISVVEGGAMRHIHVEGRLTHDEVPELEQLIGEDFGSVCLELENLRSADSAGLAALRELSHLGVVLRGVPPHLGWRIEEKRTP